MSNTSSLTTHCILVPDPHGDYRRALASLQSQTERLDAITAIGEPSAVDLVTAEPVVRWLAVPSDQPVAALNAALASNRSGLLFFLRTGDIWMPDHLAHMRSVYAEQPEIDFVFCDSAGSANPVTNGSPASDRVDLGFSAITTYFDLDFVGGPLSCLSLRRPMLERIVPLVDDAEWHGRPEMWLVLAASLAGARKCHLRRPLVQLAAATPTFGDHSQHLNTDFAFRLKTFRLVSKIARQLQFDPDYVRQLVTMEYESQSAADWPLFVKYCRYIQLHQSDRDSRRRILLSMYRRIKQHIRGSSPLTGRLKSWWLKQRLCYSRKLVA